MPTGVHLRDAREQLFAAAERVLRRDGPNALTSRAVTAEAGCAKGVLHRHFADVEDFLAQLVLDRIARVEAQGAALRGGTADAADALADMLCALFDSVAVSVLGLVTARDGLRERLRRERGAPGVPVLTEAAEEIRAYLAAEQERGRLRADADPGALAMTLVGGAHLLVAGADAAPDRAAVRAMVVTALA